MTEVSVVDWCSLVSVVDAAEGRQTVVVLGVFGEPGLVEDRQGGGEGGGEGDCLSEVRPLSPPVQTEDCPELARAGVAEPGEVSSGAGEQQPASH